MKPPPKDWPRISSGLYYRDAAKMIDWLCDAFGFVVRIKVEGDGGRIEHSELEFGEGLVMVSHEKSAGRFGVAMQSPLTTHANTQNMMVFVDDADAHCAHARARGAVITSEPADHDYGAEYWMDRTYGATDPEGHLWWFTQRLRNPPG